MKSKQSALYVVQSNRHKFGFVVRDGKVYLDLVTNANGIIDKNKIARLGADLDKTGVWTDIAKTKAKQESEV